MARPLLIRNVEFPYHVRARSNNREWFYLPTEIVWRISLEVLGIVIDRYGLSVHLFVLMSNHFHLICSTPKSNLGECMNYFMRETSKAIGRESGRINRIFGARYGWSLIENSYYYSHAYKYVARNPVVAGMVQRTEEYRFSTIPADLDICPIAIPLSGHLFGRSIPSDLEARLDWLNTPYPKQCAEVVRKGLRRSRFRFTTSKALYKQVRALEWHGFPQK
ncbi:MAG: transposase [Bdellovibrionota bacterium]